jgi:hypothetical protein
MAYLVFLDTDKKIERFGGNNRVEEIVPHWNKLHISNPLCMHIQMGQYVPAREDYKKRCKVKHYKCKLTKLLVVANKKTI